jgi:hypothetical protein
MLRQRAFSVLLALFLLLSQQMGMAHAVSHIPHHASSGASHDQSPPSEIECSECLGFAAMGAALPSPSLVASFDQASCLADIVLPAEKLRAYPVRLFDSRAPPARFL